MAKKLRPPTRAERKAGLPTSKEAAIKAGITRYVKDGEEWIIRNYGSKTAPEGRNARASNRKETRGGGADGSRAINEALATPDGADKKAFAKEMSNANAKGMDGDHIQEISRTAEGIRFKEESGRGTRQQYHKNMEAAGVPVGNQAANVQPLPPDVNQRVKPAQLRAMDEGIKKAGSEADKVFGMFRKAVKSKAFRAFGPINEYIEAIDELTGGHIDRTIQHGVNFVRQAVGQAPNPIRDTYGSQEGG